ncbi:hypothetical protein HK097_006713, partial [Rhizophlyctis rosea]
GVGSGDVGEVRKKKKKSEVGEAKPKKKKAALISEVSATPSSTPSTPPRVQDAPISVPTTPASLVVPEGEAAYERIRSPAPVPTGFPSFEPLPSDSAEEPEKDLIVVAEDDAISISYAWQVLTSGVSESILSIAVCIVLNAVGEIPVSKVKLDLSNSLIRVEEGSLELEGPVEAGQAVEGIKFKLVVPLENPRLLVPPSVVEGRVEYLVGETTNTLPITLPLPISINLLSPHLYPITPETFATLLSEPQNFPFSTSTQFSLPSTFTTPESLPSTIALLTKRTRLKVVE